MKTFEQFLISHPEVADYSIDMQHDMFSQWCECHAYSMTE